ncbi:MAG TPA: DUF2231 domain-containing protein [Mycobacteriales bacterium]|nr:DUF2231 domain-containing protein [Mycobacteriales bacterium]
MRHFTFGPSLSLSGRENKGLRGFAGKPVHPPLTDVPITAYLFTAVFDVLSLVLHGSHAALAAELYRAGTWVLLGGAAVSVLAALTGAIDWWRSSEPGTQARRTINAHATVMILVTVLVLVDLAWRLTAAAHADSAPVGVTVLSVVAALLVMAGASIGGSLVYDYGFNVETAGDHPVWHRGEGDLWPDGTTRHGAADVAGGTATRAAHS